MTGLLVQFAGLFGLVALVGGGYWRWVRPRATDFQGRGLLLLIVVTLVGGLLGSTGWWFDVPSSFSWDLPPLASRMLAAAGWAFGVATLAALRRPDPHRLRLALLMLAVYLAPLLVAILLFHLDRFDPRAPITYAFFAIVLALTVPALWYLARQPVIVPPGPDAARQPAAPVAAWLTLVAVATAAWGAALFVTDRGPARLIWAWPGDLLTSRLIAVMLLTIAAGATYSLRGADAARIMLGVVAVYGGGVVLANLWNILAGRPVNPAYLAAFGVMALVSAALLVAGRVFAAERPGLARA
jgi:hypothetical protein